MANIALPDAIQSIGDLRRLKLEGGLSFGTVVGNKLTTVWTVEGESIPLTWDAAGRTVSLPDGTDPARLALLQAAFDRLDAPPKWDAGVRALYQLAQSTVGVDVRQLDAGQRADLLALVLLNQRALEFGEDAQGEVTMTVKPLKEWVKYRVE